MAKIQDGNRLARLIHGSQFLFLTCFPYCEILVVDLPSRGKAPAEQFVRLPIDIQHTPDELSHLNCPFPSRLHTLHVPLKPLHTPLLSLLPIHTRHRVPQLLPLRLRHPIIRIEYRLPLEPLQLRHPSPNIIPVGIVLLRLTHRVEHRVTRLPPLSVITQIPIDQRLRKIPLTPPVIQQ